jgi:hypothetical protein
MTSEPPAPSVRNGIVNVRHSVPVLVRARRGKGVSIASVSLETPVALPPPVPLPRRKRSIHTGASTQASFVEREGRLWLPLDATAQGLLGSRSVKARAQATTLGLSPHTPKSLNNTWARPPELEDCDRDRVVLDISEEARAALVRRIGEDMFHDGRTILVAAPFPMASMSYRRVSIGAPEEQPSPHPFVLPHRIDDYVRFRRRFQGFRKEDEAELRGRVGRLGTEIEGLAVDPLADIARYVVLNSQHVLDAYRALSRPSSAVAERFKGASGDKVEAGLSRLLPFALRGSIGLVAGADVAEGVEVVHGFAKHLRSLCHRTGSYVITALDATIGYAEDVARPALAAIALPDEDVASLGDLARFPGGR